MNRNQPLIIIDESVRHQLGPKNSQFLEYYEIAQYSSKNLCEKVEKFIRCDISKIKNNFVLDTEVTSAWTTQNTEDLDEYVTKTTQFYIYFATISHRSTSRYNFDHENLVAPPEFIASYILMKKHYSSLENTISWLKEKKLSPRQAKKIASSAESLIKEIHKLISMKLPNDNGIDIDYVSKSAGQKFGNSVSKLSRQKDNLTFWHREFAKRKFYLDVNKDTYLKSNIDTILDHISFTINNNNLNSELCNSCRFMNKDLFWKYFSLSHKNFTNCLDAECKINSILAYNTFSILNDNKNTHKNSNLYQQILLCIYDKYEYFFTDLCTRCDPDWIGNAKTKRGYLPHYMTHEDIIFKKLINTNNITIDVGSDPDVFYKKEIRKFIQNKITNPYINKNNEGEFQNRHIEKNDSNIVGLWLWDQINIFDKRIDKKCTRQDIISILTNAEWYKNLNVYQKYKSKIHSYENSKEKHGKNDIIGPLIIEHRNDYIRVNESILTGYISTTNDALKPESLQKK